MEDAGPSDALIEDMRAVLDMDAPADMSSPTDSGVSDMSAADAGPQDSGVRDEGVPDEGPVDAGPEPDLGSSEDCDVVGCEGDWSCQFCFSSWQCLPPGAIC